MAQIIYKCWPGGRHKALTMSYDDGVTQDRRLVPLFNRHGIKGTFHINGGLFGHGEGYHQRITREEAAALYQGHEVACHTLTHPTIERCPLPLVARQVLNDREALEEITGRPVRGLSYPNGSHSAGIRALLPALGIAYSRVVGDTHSFDVPADWYTWTATCHHSQRLMEHADTFRAMERSQMLSLMYVWGHSYEFDIADNWGLIEEFCAKMGGRDDIWYATNIEIHDYLVAWDMLRFTANCQMVHNPTATELWLTADGAAVAVPPGQTVGLQAP